MRHQGWMREQMKKFLKTLLSVFPKKKDGRLGCGSDLIC